MFCIKCFSPKTKVTNSRPHKKQPTIWRRRACSQCQAVFTTLERPSLDGLQVRASNGTTEPFNIGRLVVSLAGAFAHDHIKGRDQALWLAQTVETTLATEHPQPSAEEIAAISHQTLKRFDPLAAMQYGAKHRLVKLG